MTHKKVRVTDITRFGTRIDLSVFRFDWSEVLFLEMKSLNSKEYISWVISLMEEITPKSIRDHVGITLKYSIISFFMNSRNLTLIYDNIDMVDWINWAPVVCDCLGDDEYGIDVMNSVVERGHDGA